MDIVVVLIVVLIYIASRSKKNEEVDNYDSNDRENIWHKAGK